MKSRKPGSAFGAPLFRVGNWPGKAVLSKGSTGQNYAKCSIRDDKPPLKAPKLGVLRVSRLPGRVHVGRLLAGPCVMRCALGRSGLTHAKREGDGATPIGILRIEATMTRRDRLYLSGGPTPLVPIRSHAGWCDDPAAGAYNRPVQLPSAFRHEELWRSDHVYDVIMVLDWNRQCIVKGRGSAIFFHLARPDFSPTEGCVAIALTDMRRLLPRLSKTCRLVVT